MDAREEMRRFGHCSTDPAKHVKDEEAFWAGVRKGLRLMRHRDIREEVAFKKQFPQTVVRRPSLMSHLVRLLPILLVLAVCMVAAWRLLMFVPN
jgi:hypothetical protein